MWEERVDHMAEDTAELAFFQKVIDGCAGAEDVIGPRLKPAVFQMDECAAEEDGDSVREDASGRLLCLPVSSHGRPGPPVGSGSRDRGGGLLCAGYKLWSAGAAGRYRFAGGRHCLSEAGGHGRRPGGIQGKDVPVVGESFIMRVLHNQQLRWWSNALAPWFTKIPSVA